MTTLTEIEAAADALPKGQKEQLLAFLAAKLGWDGDRSKLSEVALVAVPY